MYILTVQYITLHNTLEQLQFLLPQPHIGGPASEWLRFSTTDGANVSLDTKRVYYSVVTPYTPPAAPEKGADEAKLS